MKLIQQSKLFFKEGNSDKVYEIDLCELSSDKYLVNFRYGKRGATLKEGTKTPAAIPRGQAEIVFAELENEKRKKGYQTETEIFVQLPSLENVELKSAKGAILYRLQDALTGTKTFKTEWKLSRVIWKAGVLQIEEAIPLIIKLAGRGDEIQAYCALWALINLKALQAGPVFTAFASNIRQKRHIRNLAWEGLLAIAGEDERLKLGAQLLGQLPDDLRYAIEANDSGLVMTYLAKGIEEGIVDYFPTLYLLTRVHTWLLPAMAESLKKCSFRPPYFKQIRAIYKLAQLRKDTIIVAALSYRFEKEEAMFRRSGLAGNDSKKFIPQIGQSVRVDAELKSEESKLAFSNFTKEYFVKKAIEYLHLTGQKGDATTYVKLAMATLLQYSQADYTPAGERPLSNHGQYDYRTRKYTFILFNYPECSESLLLSTILFGNDATRTLAPNGKFIFGKREVTSSKYYYSPGEVQAVVGSSSRPPASRAAGHPSQPTGGSLIKAAVNVFKNLFGKKELPKQELINVPSPLEIQQKTVAVHSRVELYPEYWDSKPESYVQLLMQARMHFIHRFAFDSLTAHPEFEEIISRFDQKALLQLLNSSFELPGQFGFEILQRREAEFYPHPGFMGQVLDSNNSLAREWAMSWVNKDAFMYLDDLDFTLSLLFNTRQENNQWIDVLLAKATFNEDRVQAILGKTITELLHLPNAGNNNELAKNTIRRLHIIAASQMERISWAMVGQLMSSPLEANKILAGDILISKTAHTAPTEIPVSVTELFLKNEVPEVRRNGLKLLNNYPDEFLIENFPLVLALTDSVFQDVTEAGLSCIHKLIVNVPALGNQAIHHLVFTLIRKEKFEGAHPLIRNFIVNELKPYWNSGLQPKDITRLVHSQYRPSQLAGYDILKGYNRLADFSIGQIISFGSHEILAIRQWCWNYFSQNIDRIRQEKGKALSLLDSSWDDTRAFGFHFFSTEFIESDWDADTLISIVDSVRPDVESFGKGLITRYFKPEQAMDYLTRLSEHPSLNVQAFVTNYLSLYAADKPELLQQLDFYFRSVLTRVNKGRVAKDRILDFLHQEAIKSEIAAYWVASIVDEVAVQDTIHDKATCIHILTEIKNRYQNVDMHLVIKN